MGRLNEASAAKTRDVTISIRAQQQQRDLIDEAAALLGKTRSDFMLEIAYREAEAVFLDRKVFPLDEKRFNEFVAMLDAPPKDNHGLRELMKRIPIWER